MPEPRYTEEEIRERMASDRAIEAATRSWWKGFDSAEPDYQRAMLADHRIAVGAALDAAFQHSVGDGGEEAGGVAG